MFRMGDCDLISIKYKFNSIRPRSSDVVPEEYVVWVRQTQTVDLRTGPQDLAIDSTLPKVEDPTTLTRGLESGMQRNRRVSHVW
jgi:hypothetical protein